MKYLVHLWIGKQEQTFLHVVPRFVFMYASVCVCEHIFFIPLFVAVVTHVADTK